MERKDRLSMQEEKWLNWLTELQALAQAGLAYGRDPYDLERFAAIRILAVQMLSDLADLPEGKVREVFANEKGYQTPKIDTRAAIFKSGKILLVQEGDGNWTLPGGWCDVNLSVAENTIKEVKEEAGLDVAFERLIAVLDRDKHNRPVSVHKICKFFSLCSVKSGVFTENLETVASAYFAVDKLPSLAEAKTNKEQIAMCFKAYADENWQPVID